MSVVPLIDSHVHLQDPAFRDDLAEVLACAKENGIERFLCNGTGPDDWAAVRQLAARHEEIVPFYGVHPWYAAAAPSDWEERLVELLDDENFSGGIGEIGLDRLREPKSLEIQERVFRAQLRLAKDRELPVAIHSVRAIGDVAAILRGEGPFPAVLLHSFSGPGDRIEFLAKLGGYFSFSATVLKAGNRRVREAAIAVPWDRILVESDAPALSPEPGCRNEPTILLRILKELAALRNLTETRLREIVLENAGRFLQALQNRRKE